MQIIICYGFRVLLRCTSRYRMLIKMLVLVYYRIHIYFFISLECTLINIYARAECECNWQLGRSRLTELTQQSSEWFWLCFIRKRRWTNYTNMCATLYYFCGFRARSRCSLLFVEWQQYYRIHKRVTKLSQCQGIKTAHFVLPARKNCFGIC